MEADLQYYLRRSAEESAAAESAHNSKVREIHLELARRYAERIAALNATVQRASLHLVG
jgi:Skp family chaperone for outer membrane proteins